MEELKHRVGLKVRIKGEDGTFVIGDKRNGKYFLTNLKTMKYVGWRVEGKVFRIVTRKPKEVKND
jgi:hypothetical protein